MGKLDGGLRSLFRDYVPADWCTVETGMTAQGVPDSNFCAQGVEGWVEYKQTTGWAVTLRTEQIGWITRRCRAGGRVFIAVRRRTLGGARTEAADELWLCRGSYAPDLKLNGLREAPQDALLGRWTGGPSRWDWPAVREILTALPSDPSVRHLPPLPSMRLQSRG